MADVVMPQMGESIAEGTIVRWIKKVGDTVERDEPLFEISTDKVDAEIPSPAAGVVTEIRAREGETVPINTVVAVIGAASAAEARPAPAAPSPAPPAMASVPSPAPGPSPVAPPPPAPQPQAEGSQTASARERRDVPPAKPASAPHPQGRVTSDSAAGPMSTEDALRQRSSPLVRRIAKEHNIDISRLQGTGIAGRVTKNDILAVVGGSERAAAAPPAARPAAAPPAAAPRPAPTNAASGAGLAGQSVPMTVMRRKIAEHMLVSRRTSAHVHSVFEVNFHNVEKARQAHKGEYEVAGAKLTYLSFILKAAVDALRVVPVVNASVDGESIVYHKQINVGIAVALDWGLIVPVVRNADEKNLLGLSRAVADLANRARSKQLKPDEVSGGTFTITNPGVFGALFGMPIINQPQVAILGVGAVEKRPVVVDDAIAIRPMAYLALGYDHRIIDGAVADEFMSHIKHTIERWDPSQA
jgi:2-oxoglutarate dehydrogenase E2 component (dihydrolipoamide succinyltransferase)